MKSVQEEPNYTGQTMLVTRIPVIVLCLAAQAMEPLESQDAPQYDLLTPSTFGFDSNVHLGSQANGGVEKITAFATVSDSTLCRYGYRYTEFNLGLFCHSVRRAIFSAHLLLQGTVTDTQSSTSASSVTVSDALFSLLTSSCSIFTKVQFSSGNSMDGYLPLPVSSQGTAFVTSSWNSGTSFVGKSRSKACFSKADRSVSQLTATRLTDNADLTPLLTFTSFTGTVYSTATLSLTDSSVIHLQTTDGSTFQVIQYGGISGTDGAYAFPAGALVTCNDSISTSTSATATSNGASRIVAFLPDAALFTLTAVIALALLGATAEALRRWKLGPNAKTRDQCPDKSFVSESAASDTYAKYYNDKTCRKKTPNKVVKGNNSVPPQFHEKHCIEDNLPRIQYFNTKASADSSFIQVKPYIAR
ncbi:hypothetical protein EGW08_001331 [Elysia chlorotica]|uniref:Uncharacterized protein n=1 Tax=Elysia chlorotica TaxID=188477 RepID=A0A433UAS8_ELYCH|nr:hypothetical protein EGW08_001331 [Elysia chlorotica]